MSYTGKDVSIILPWIREEGAKKCLEAVKKYAPDAEVVSEYDPDRIGPAKMIAKLTAKTTRPIVCFLADDTVPMPGFLDAALQAMETLPDGWGVVGLNDYDGRELGAHWVAHKKILPLLDGEFHYTGYGHCFGSNELTDRAKELGKYVKAWDAAIEHNNPVLQGDDYTGDPMLVAVYGADGNKADDRKLYWKRKRARLKKIAIGFPLVDDTVPVQFFTSFACMQKPTEYTLLLPEFPHGPWTGSIADARNSLVAQALHEGASYLMMADTDQVYPQDALTKLLSHKVDICGVRVHSRWFPYAPVFYRGTVGKYQFIPNEEMYSGKLVEIDATGTGCLLLNMEIFDRLEPPWFKFSMNREKPVGEDIYFCHKAREAGIKIYVDTSIEVGHLATVEINETLHKLCQKMAKTEE